MIQKITTLYKYGFIYKGVTYGWKDKKLFKLPYIKNNRSYQLKEIPLNCFKSTLVANIQREKLTINKLKKLTFEINSLIISYIDDGFPF
jgi:hypothetical protein